MAEKTPLTVSNSPKDQDENKPLKVRRGRVESVDLYEIKDSELDLLEKGSPADLQLNFAVFLLSTAVNGICTLASASFSNETIKNIFLFATVVSVVFGGYLIISWLRNRSSLKEACTRIRSRIQPDVAMAVNQEVVVQVNPEDSQVKG